MSTVKTNSPQTLSTLEQSLSEKDQIIAKQKQALLEQERRIAVLEESLRLHKLKKFGASSEKSPDQQEMFNEAELMLEVEDYLAESEAKAEPTETKAPKAKPGRKPLPTDLPRVRIEHDLSEADKKCPCGCERTEIGEVSSEQLDIIPAQVRVLVNVRKKYACPACENGVETAPLPSQPIPKSNASPGLLAHIVTAKYQDALPLYRQEAILNRSGLEIPRNTLANWMVKSGELVQPLLNLLEDKMLAQKLRQAPPKKKNALSSQSVAALTPKARSLEPGAGPRPKDQKLRQAPPKKKNALSSQSVAALTPKARSLEPGARVLSLTT